MMQLYDWDNLLLAYRKAAKGKRGHADVADFEYRLEANLLQLQRELKDQNYQPGEYHSFYIQFNASIQGWVNHVRWGNTWRLRVALLN